MIPVSFQPADSERDSSPQAEANPEQGRGGGALIPPASEGTPEEIWGKFFQQDVPPDLVREIVQKLHLAGKFDHVIAAIEAAISSGQIQPWMYEVLALTMEAEGRSKEEIDRVLLSTLDLGPQDYESTLYLAAYLVRFHREERALELYRQVSQMAPERAEPYLMGLRLAREKKDIDGIEWGACGILRHAWGKDHEVQQRETQHAAADALKILKDRGEQDRARAFQAALDAARQRDLYVRVDWNGDADLDLLVTEPGGEQCDAEHPISTGGGRFIHDGFGLETERTGSFDAYLCREGRSGEYKISVRYIRGKVVANRATLTVIQHQGTPDEKTSKSTVAIGTEDAVKTIRLESGRLKDPK